LINKLWFFRGGSVVTSLCSPDSELRQLILFDTTPWMVLSPEVADSLDFTK